MNCNSKPYAYEQHGFNIIIFHLLIAVVAKLKKLCKQYSRVMTIFLQIVK